jgi:hypothetical protein
MRSHLAWSLRVSIHLKIILHYLSVVVYACNLEYSEGRSWGVENLRIARAKLVRPYLNKTPEPPNKGPGGMACLS